MSPILPKKKYKYILVEENVSLIDLNSQVNEILENNENVLLLIPDSITNPEEVEKKLKERFWRKLNEEKIRTLIVPEISSIILFDTTEIEIKKLK
jgi:hypothetical protein